MKGVWVYVGVSPGMERAGVTKNQVRTDVELNLRRNGIKVFALDEDRQTPGAPFYYVNVQIKKIRQNFYCYNIEAHLLQLAILQRDGILPIVSWDSTTRVTTYITYSFGVATTIKQIHEAIDDTVRIFCNDFLSVNQK